MLSDRGLFGERDGGRKGKIEKYILKKINFQNFEFHHLNSLEIS